MSMDLFCRKEKSFTPTQDAFNPESTGMSVFSIAKELGELIVEHLYLS